jgi:L-glutamine---4-(methylsulfanyl)-2-oxobutanoate aminotransferase
MTLRRASAYDRAMRSRPRRIDDLPQQYFARLLADVSAAAAREGEPLVDLGRGNPEVGPPRHVVERLAKAARSPAAHGYSPFRGLPELREAIAARYADVYGVALDASTQVAIVPGTKTALAELALVLAERGDTVLLPDPGYPDYPSGVALAEARAEPLPLERERGWAPSFAAVAREDVAGVYLNYPSNPCAVAAPPGAFADAVRFANETGAAVVHDLAYGDLVFDGRRPESFLATPGALDVAVELYSMSKTYGMAGWRIGFVVGQAELVERVNEMSDHSRVGIFAPLQEAAIAALTGPQESVEERRLRYELRRDRVLDALAGLLPSEPASEGTFYVWLELPTGVTFETLLLEHRVVVAPGDGFGSRGTGWARLSLAVTDETLDRGLERLRAALVAAEAAVRD